ncbi:MAG: TetR/AcrR family transcriptional regulator, partial [Nocardiaceae bacterium]|nr:TetR/AcrR family transcriptional regulator [Nocardiaceae bacterium]
MTSANVSDAAAVQERILHAAVECFAQKGIGKTSMEDVARVAKLARSGVYRYFGTKGELIDAALLRELGRYLQGLDELSRDGGDVAEMAADGLVFTIQFIRGSVLLGELLLTNPEWLL